MEEKTLFTHLAQFACAVRDNPVPEIVLEEAKYCLLDTLGCMIAGAVLPDGRDFARMEHELHPGAQARVIGRKLALSEAGAARVNAYNGDILELNDLIGGHASIGSVSAALALQETTGMPGERFLRALVAGIEVTARVNAGYRESHEGQDSKPFTEVGISSEGIPSTIGVSALTSVALGLSPQQTAEALAIGGTLAGWCPVEVLFGVGGTVKPMMFGAWPATVGMMAGRYAGAGMTGPKHLLESKVGLYATLARNHDPEILKGSRGWALERPRRKWHACCGFIHAGLDGVIALRQQYGTGIFENAEIEISVVPPVATILTGQKRPETATEARFSGRYCVSLGLHGVDCIMPEHSDQVVDFTALPDIRRTMEKVRYIGMEELPHFSHSVVKLAGPEGERASIRIAGYKGSQDNPLSHDEVISKFLRLAWKGVKQPEKYIEKLLKLETFDRLDWLYRDLVEHE